MSFKTVSLEVPKLKGDKTQNLNFSSQPKLIPTWSIIFIIVLDACDNLSRVFLGGYNDLPHDKLEPLDMTSLILPRHITNTSNFS